MSEEQKITKCPHCGSTYAYQRKVLSRYLQLYQFDGTPIDANEIESDYINKKAFCFNCGKDVTKYVKGYYNE